MLFNNLKTNEECLEHLSMINALNLVLKLQKKPWVDKEIEDRLDELWEYFENNYQEFSSFEKWKKQVERGALTVVGSPCHTEKFWQAAFIYFNDADNLECIDQLIRMINDPNQTDGQKAVACYDLGEYARFSPVGKQYLESKGAKEAIITIMGNKNASPELKKEAITSYQRILMKAHGTDQSQAN